MTKLPALPTISTLADADLKYAVDVSNTGDHPTGSSAGITHADERAQSDLWLFPLTVAALATLGSTHAAGDVVTVKNYSTAEDGGGGDFRLDTAGTFVITGTHTGSSEQAVLTDSTKDWAVSSLVGRTITNDTDGSTTTITANTATTITGVLAGGTDNDWDASDAYTLSHDDGGVVVKTTGGTNWIWRRVIENGNRVNPLWWGAKADYPTTDDAAAIQSAAWYCHALNATAVVTPALIFPLGLYRTLTTITVLPNIDIYMAGEIVYDGGSESAAGLVVGQTDVINPNVKLRLRVGRNGVSDWTDEGSIGIKLINTDRSDLFAAVCSNFSVVGGGYTIGLQCIGSATGTASRGYEHCHMRLGGIFNCKYGIDLANESAGSGKGFTNSNWFYGGTIAFGSGIGSGLSRYGVRVRSVDGNNKSINNNTFYALSIQLRTSDASPGEALPVLIENGQDNAYYDLRNESNGPVIIRVLDDPTVANRSNHIEWTHTDSTFDDQSREASTTGGAIRDRIINRPSRLVFDSGPMDRNIHYFNGSTTVHIPNVHLMVTGSGDTPSDNITDAGITAFVAETFTVDTATEEIIDTAHEMRVDDVIFFTTTGALPTSSPQITVTDPAYVISTTTDRFKISDVKGGSEITFSAGGSPTNTYEGRTRYLNMVPTYGVGVYADMSQCKQLMVTRDIDSTSANGGRVVVIPYDGQNVRLVDNVTFTVVQATSNVNLNATAHGMPNDEKIYLDSSTNDLPLNLLEDTVYYVVNQTANDFEVSLTLGGSSVTFDDDGSGTLKFDLVDRWVKGKPQSFWTTAFGGAYYNTSNMLKNEALVVRSEVKRINVIVACVTGTIRLRKFQIHVPELELTPDIFVGYSSGVQNRFFATVPPTEGVYTDLGMRIAENAPASAATPGWVLTVIGAPGTWVGEAVLL